MQSRVSSATEASGAESTSSTCSSTGSNPTRSTVNAARECDSFGATLIARAYRAGTTEIATL